ncbi:MAG: NAD(P)H-hydrate dehydratase [Cardiobacteriaceae bacterium]|nr:NAD(P)H-hydrate dehydratase [Cardiobacteriaceae bacterium]
MKLHDFIPILNAKENRELDQYTCRKQEQSALDLMERAAFACASKILKLYPKAKGFQVLCGFGDNGGDGLAIARMLAEQGHRVEVYLMVGEKRSPDNFINLQRLTLQPQPLSALVPDDEAVVIDALFGIGLTRGLEAHSTAYLSALFDEIRDSGAQVVAIDVPSGLWSNQSGAKVVLRAHHTLCLGAIKPSLLWAEYEAYVGQLHFLDIGLEHIEAPCYQLTALGLAVNQPQQSAFIHKGDRGRVVMVAGSEQYYGAAVLAAKAALRMGCGLLSARIPERWRCAFHQNVWEAMTFAENEHPKAQALLVGCGLGRERSRLGELKALCQHYAEIPSVWDADAIHLLAEDESLQQHLPRGAILTPHVKEFERLTGFVLESDAERVEAARAVARDLGVTLVLKGRYTVIASPNAPVFINPTGNTGLAKGGSGDVLAGMMAGLLAQGYEPLLAAMTAVFLHGRAAELAALEQHVQSMLPSDLLHYFAQAWRSLEVAKP